MVVKDKLREFLKKNLPRDYAEKIAKETGVHRNTVYNVLNKEHENIEVFEALVSMAQDYLERKARLTQIAEQMCEGVEKTR